MQMIAENVTDFHSIKDYSGKGKHAQVEGVWHDRKSGLVHITVRRPSGIGTEPIVYREGSKVEVA